MVPLLKPGKSPLYLLSYCPVALASCIGKLMEKMIFFRMEWLLEKEKAYHDIMSGFRHGRSSIDGVIYLIMPIEQFKTQRRFSAKCLV